MPYAPPKPCPKSLCPKFRELGDRFCPQHQREYDQDVDHRRGSSYRRGYNKRWSRYARILIAENPLCADGCGRAATVVDHIVPVYGPDDPLFWEPTNHQTMYKPCHDRKTAKEDGGFKGRRRRRPEDT